MTADRRPVPAWSGDTLPGLARVWRGDRGWWWQGCGRECGSFASMVEAQLAAEDVLIAIRARIASALEPT